MAVRIPRDFLDHLLARIDLVDLIGARLPLRKAGREFVACCPFHTEKTPSFTVSPTKQFYHCFGCGAHGNAISFLMDYERLGFLDAVEELARSAGLELPRGVSPEQPGQDAGLEWLAQATQFFRRQLREHPLHHKALDYLRRRGLSDEIIDAFGIGYAPPGWDNLLKALNRQGAAPGELVKAGLAIASDNGACHDRFRDRIMFPIRDRRGRPIAFGARTLGDAQPKYLNSPETPFFHKGRQLYGLYEARLSERQLHRLLVVEGYMDVVALAQHGIRWTVATLGTAATAEQLEQLFRTVSDIVFCFDGDRAGREAAWRALENALPLLRDGRQASFLFLPEGEDPDSLVRREGPESFAQRLTQAQPLSDYLFQKLTAAADLHSIDGRARLAGQARPLIDRLPDSLYRDMMIERLAVLTEISRTILEKRLANPAPTLSAPNRSDAHLTRTPVRRAIALLLKRPELARLAGDLASFPSPAIPGLPLLLQLTELLCELLNDNPAIVHAALWERYRDTEEERILKKLAQWLPEIPEDLYESEFLGALEELKKRYSPEKQLLNQLIAKGKLEELSMEEKQLLRHKSNLPKS